MVPNINTSILHGKLMVCIGVYFALAGLIKVKNTVKPGLGSTICELSMGMGWGLWVAIQILATFLAVEFGLSR